MTLSYASPDFARAQATLTPLRPRFPTAGPPCPAVSPPARHAEATLEPEAQPQIVSGIVPGWFINTDLA